LLNLSPHKIIKKRKMVVALPSTGKALAESKRKTKHKSSKRKSKEQGGAGGQAVHAAKLAKSSGIIKPSTI
jgi:hypothetical protein